MAQFTGQSTSNIITRNLGSYAFALWISAAIALFSFLCAVTVFFLDTACNLFNTLQSLYDTLDVGGKWINFGPLLWHYEDVPYDAEADDLTDQTSEHEDRSMGLEFALEDVVELVEKIGFKFEKRESDIPCSYTHAYQSMGGFVYKCEYWVATKI